MKTKWYVQTIIEDTRHGDINHQTAQSSSILLGYGVYDLDIDSSYLSDVAFRYIARRLHKTTLQLTVLNIANFVSKLCLLHYIVIDISQTAQNSPNCSKTSDFSQTHSNS